MEQISKANDPEALHQQLLQSFTDFELSFRRRFPVIWLVTLLAPFVVSAGLILFFGWTESWGYSQKLIGHALMTFFIFGRLIILCGLDPGITKTYMIALSPGELFGLVTYLDFMVALFVTFHMGFLFRTPYVGPKVAMLVWDGKFLLNAQPWVKRIAFVGLIGFVIFPTSTTGSIGGSIFGRLLGLNHYITPGNVWVKIVGVILLVALFGLVEVRYRFVKKKYMAAAKKRAEKSQSQTAENNSDKAENQSSPTDDTPHS